MGALAWFRRHWKAILGGIFLIPPILRGLRFVLDFGGYIDFVVAHMTQPGWLGIVIADLVDPPSGLILPLILLGLGLIYWDSRRSAVRAPEAAGNDPRQPIGAELQITAFMGGGLPEQFPNEGRIYRLAVSYRGAAADVIGFNERYGPPGDACAAQWHPEFRVGTVYRCEITNYGECPIFSISMSFRVEFREAIETNQTPRLIQAGEVIYAYDRGVTLASLGPGSRFIFYAHNESALFAAIGIPNVASYMTLGENASREHPLLPPNIAVLSFPPSEIVS